MLPDSEVVLSSGGTLFHSLASSTAAAASTMPKPYSWLKWYTSDALSEPYLTAPSSQPELRGSFLRAEAARMSLRSLHVKGGFAWRNSAATPATWGVDADVPENSGS